MKTKLIKTERGYPKIMKSNSTTAIVLFSEPEVGTVLGYENPIHPYPIGHHSSYWDMDGFEDYDHLFIKIPHEPFPVKIEIEFDSEEDLMIFRKGIVESYPRKWWNIFKTAGII
jgi:hypothetical protein